MIQKAKMIKAKIFYQKKRTFKKNDRAVRKLPTHAPVAEACVRVKIQDENQQNMETDKIIN